MTIKNANRDVAEVTDAEYNRAVEAAQNEPRAQSVRYDRHSKRLQIELQDSIAVMIPVASIQGLEQATPKQIEAVEMLADGYALSWPDLDADATVSGLVAGVLGTRKWMRQIAVGFLTQAGRKGSSASSGAKRATSRANGKLGGRPRKKVTESMNSVVDKVDQSDSDFVKVVARRVLERSEW